MSELSLNELLDSVGMSRTQLAKLICTSPSTVKRMGDDVEPYVLEAINAYRLSGNADIPVPTIKNESKPMAKQLKNVEDYTPKETKLLCMRRVDESDYDIACSLGMRVHTFRQMIQSLVAYCHNNTITSQSLLS